MKKKLLITLFLILCVNLFAGEDEKGSKLCSHKKSNMQLAAIEDHSELKHSFNVLHYKLDLDLYNNFISPYPKSFTGSVTVTLTADSVINSISLNAVNTSLGIDSVSFPGTSFTHINNILTISLDRVYAVGETLSVKIYYNHKNVTDNAFYVSSGFMFTDCEPQGARKWFPCWDMPSDKATVELKAKVPATVKLGSNGRLADSIKTADTIYYHWISRDPVATYLVVISAKVNYNLDIINWLSPSNEIIPFRFYWNQGENTTNINNMKNKTLLMADHFSELFGEHPFEKNGFATLNSQFSWGGMENQTLTSLCPNCWYESLICHEFAHQWFGDMITCATWADLFLNEGFATFLEAVWLEHTGGYSSYKNAINQEAQSYLSSNPGWPISNPSWAFNPPGNNQLFNYAITYAKGACVLHLLRYVLGDSLFFSSIKNYATHPDIKNRSAKISDLIAVVNSTTGEDYNWFFDQWIFEPNHPKYQNNYWIVQQGSVWEVGFIAKQTQTTPAFFKMPLEIKIKFSSGPDSLVKVMNAVNEQMFTFYFDRQPSAVEFDPGNQIVLKTATLTQIPPVPVELISFTADVKGSFVVLNWATASELNNKGFEVHKYKVQGSSPPLAGSYGKDKVNEGWQAVSFIDGKGTTTLRNEYQFVDPITSFGKYKYRLKQIDFDGSYEYSNEIIVTAGEKPSSYKLHNNFPNPFNPSTVIKFELPDASNVQLAVYNLMGELISILIEGNLDEGIYEVPFNGSQLSSGVYIYKLTANNYSASQTMMLMK